MTASTRSAHGTYWETPACDGKPRGRLLLLHGAGAPADSPWMNAVAETLAAGGLTVYRAEFSYMAQRRTDGKKRPPPKAERLLDELNAMVENLPGRGLPLILAGKSMGGRLATLYAADRDWSEGDNAPDQVWVFGYPFHPPGKPDRLRTAHLPQVPCPVRIMQGSRDAMGNADTVSSLDLGEPVSLRWVASGNHDLRPLGLSRAEVIPRLQADIKTAMSEWC